MVPPFKPQPTAVYERELDDGVQGEAYSNGTILVQSGLHEDTQQDVINHEEGHIDQIKRGDLDYDDKAVYWKGKKYLRSKMTEGDRNLPWEKEAYKKS